MRLQKLVLFVAALMFLATSAYATNRVEVKVTSEPIKEDSTCDKAGGFSLEFDTGSAIVPNDLITMDTTLNTTLCKDILPTVGGLVYNLYVYNENNVNSTGAMQWGNAVVAPDTVFKIRGLAGTQRVSVQLIDGSVAVDGADPNAFFQIRFLDQTTGLDLIAATGYNATSNLFENPRAVTIADQTLCIDVSNPLFTASTVDGSMDSSDAITGNDKFTFIPSNPQIAHIVQKDTFTLVQCTKPEIGLVCPGTPGGQGGKDTCSDFDYDASLATSSSGIDDPDTNNLLDVDNNRLIFRANPGFDASGSYFVEMTILVDDQTGDNGVYFASNSLGYAKRAGSSATDLDLLCAAAITNGDVADEFLASGASGVASPSNGCDVPASGARVVKLVGPTGNLGLNAGDQLLKINVPAMRYDRTVVSTGEVIKLKVDIKKWPCSSVTSQIITIATIGCPASEGTSYSLTYPYFTQMGGDDWWDGIVITNLGSTPGTATLTIYEQDGDVGTYTTPVIAGNSMYVNLLENILPMLTQTAGAGALGNAPVWVKVSTTFNADGFGMIAEGDNAFDSMGYLPRTSYTMPMYPINLP